MKGNEIKQLFVEVDFLWNRTVDSLKTSFHPLLWTSSGLKESAIPSDLMKSTAVDESLSSMNQSSVPEKINFYNYYNRMRNLHQNNYLG